MMNYIYLLIFISLNVNAQITRIDKEKIKVDLDEMLSDISNYYIYLDEKKIDFSCIEQTYKKKINEIETENDRLLFFEYLLDEFYDSHLILNSNIKTSFRLYAPLYIETNKEVSVIKNVWQTQTEGFPTNIIEAKILKFNGRNFQQLISNFPTHCNDKTDAAVKNWIANKLIAGRYNEPRILTLKLKNGEEIELDLDEIEIKKENELLNTEIINDIGLIRINNALGEEKLIKAFDEALDALFDTKGLIIDLRNTVGGGDSYIARAILGRFIEASKAYQKHWTVENYGNHPPIERSWIEYVSPREKYFDKPVVVIVGRWTASMGEGLAIGFEGIERGKIIGTEMHRLSGAVENFSFIHNEFGYQLSTEKLFHVNGTRREKCVPEIYVQQTKLDVDEAMRKAINIINDKSR